MKRFQMILLVVLTSAHFDSVESNPLIWDSTSLKGRDIESRGLFKKALLPLLIGVVLKIASIIPAKLGILAFILSGSIIMAKLGLVIAVIAALLQHSQITQHDYKSYVVPEPPAYHSKDLDWTPAVAASSVDGIVNSVSQTSPSSGPSAVEPLTASGSFNVGATLSSSPGAYNVGSTLSSSPGVFNVDSTYFPYSNPLSLNFIKRYEGSY